MRKITLLSALALGGSFFLGGQAPAQDIDVQGLWDRHCKKCHGSDGKGQTRVGKKLKLGDYTDPAFQATFTDEEAIRITLEGVKDEAGKETMQPYKDDLNEAEVKALVDYIRAFAASA
jgi:cytochrome c6